MSPTSWGRLRRRTRTNGITASEQIVTVAATACQERCTASHDSSGRNTSWPAAPPAVSTPVNSPLWRTNQRLVTVATNASAIEPVPRPTSSPQHTMSCQLRVMKRVSPLPVATSASAPDTTARIPNRSINAAANGDVSPYSIRLTMTAAEIVPWDQPNSRCNGSISTLGVARKLPAPMSARNATRATDHARWIRGATGWEGAVDKGPSLGARPRPIPAVRGPRPSVGRP